MIRLYAFLGNHGREYRNNRHNVGWLFLESLPFYGELRWERKFRGRFATRESPAGRIYILMPETFMNLSGDSAAELMRFYQILPEELLAIHDELELPFGVFGFKQGGGLGGHNGLRSLEARLGTRDYCRLRFGIGRPEHALTFRSEDVDDLAQRLREAYEGRVDVSGIARRGNIFVNQERNWSSVAGRYLEVYST